VAIRSWATQSALVDPSEVVVRSAVIQTSGIPIVATRSAVIQNAEIQSGVDRDAMGVVQNGVILFVAPSVAPNAATLSVVLNVAQDVALVVVIQCVVTPFAVTRIAVDRCEANLDAMVDSQDAFLFLVQALV